jgi:hypothetical protein
VAHEVVSWVLNDSRSRNAARLVLIVIAEAARRDGAGAWLSVATIQRKAQLSRRAVQSATNDLEALGELHVDEQAGPRGVNVYDVLMTPADSAPRQNLPGAESAPAQDPRPTESAPDQTSTEADTPAQDPAQSLPGAESAPAQNTTSTRAESAPKPNTSPSQKTSSSSREASPKRSRGTRIPDDFAMTPEMIDWGLEHFPHLDGAAVTAEFVDYWRGVPGAKGEKLDWIATWRNQVRREAKRTTGQRPGPGPAGRTVTQQGLDDAARIAAEMRALDQADAEAAGQPPPLFNPHPGRAL